MRKGEKEGEKHGRGKGMKTWPLPHIA